MLPVHGLHGHIENTGLRSLILFLGFALSLCLIWPVVYITACLIGFMVLPTLSICLFMVPPLAKAVLFLGGASRKALFGVIQSPELFLETLYIPLTVAVLWLAFGLWLGIDLVRNATGSRSLTRREEPVLFNLVENLAITAGIPMPAIDMIEDDARNAFAIGWNPASATITVTRGLLRALTKAELEAVLAHELTHIINRDSRVNLVAAVVNGLMAAVANRIWTRYTLHHNTLDEIFFIRGDETDLPQAIRRQRCRIQAFWVLNGSPAMMLIGHGIDRRISVIFFVLSILTFGWLVVRYVADWRSGQAEDWNLGVSLLPSVGIFACLPLLPLIIPLWLLMVWLGSAAALGYGISAWVAARISQAREFMADAGAIELTKNPAALCSALRKVEGHENLRLTDVTNMAMMISSRRGGVFATHPPLEERLNMIRAHCGTSNAIVNAAASPAFVEARTQSAVFATSTSNQPRARRPARVKISARLVS
jgi:Zn-dependent protease with chaperone function